MSKATGKPPKLCAAHESPVTYLSARLRDNLRSEHLHVNISTSSHEALIMRSDVDLYREFSQRHGRNHVHGPLPVTRRISGPYTASNSRHRHRHRRRIGTICAQPKRHWPRVTDSPRDFSAAEKVNCLFSCLLRQKPGFQ